MHLFLTRLLLSLLLAGGLAAQDPRLERGSQLLRQQKPAEAEALFAAVVGEDEQNARAWMLLGYARQAQGRFEDALVAHERAAGFAPTAATGAFNSPW